MNDHPLILKAAEIATSAHSGQTRWDKETPYISHPAAVARGLKHHPYVQPWEIAAAWLHDVLEDTFYTAAQLSAELKNTVGVNYMDIAKCVNTVEILTRRKNDKYNTYVQGILFDTPAMRIKILDATHNMSCFEKPQGSLYDKYSLLVMFLMRELGESEANLMAIPMAKVVS